MDLTVHNLILGTESNLRNIYNKFTKLSSEVARDLEAANATQAQFEAESDYQIQVEEEVAKALILEKRKREEYKEILATEERKSQEQTFMLMFDTQQRAADAARAQERLIRHQEIQNQRNLFPTYSRHPASAALVAGNPAPVPASSTKLPKRQIKPFKGEV